MKIAADRIRIKRVYEKPALDDGTRILVDRLWPRGVKKAEAAVDDWGKDLAPSTELRRWFGHDPERWQEFRERYTIELREHVDELERLRGLARARTVTLIYSAHDEAHNHAIVLRDVLLGK